MKLNVNEVNVNYSWLPEYMQVSDISAGIREDGSLTSLNLIKTDASRQEILDYFNNGWAITEMLFSCFVSDEVFFQIPYHGLRHPMLFYYGHVPALYVNKLRLAGIIKEPVNSYIESVFETGIDEMRWDDIPKPREDWPTLSDVRRYREQVYNMIVDVIKTHSDIGKVQITQDNPLWGLIMSFEHERIHIETSSVLIRELPLSLVKTPEGWPEFDYIRKESFIPAKAVSYPENELITINKKEVKLGKPENYPTFGWDNEYGKQGHKAESFSVSKFLVSNGQFYEFVQNHGYYNDEYWSEEGLKWRKFRNIKHPTFWIQVGPAGLNHYKLRTLFKEITMQWDWPVIVNYHEAQAFCNWESAKEGKKHELMKEKEYALFRTGEKDYPVSCDYNDLRENKINLQLAFGSEQKVSDSKTNKYGIHDQSGNVWQWSEDCFYALKGFKTNPLYHDFSTPCFDGQHQMIFGGSFMSTGDEASIYARFHFRPHFFQHAGFRYVVRNLSDNKIIQKGITLTHKKLGVIYIVTTVAEGDDEYVIFKAPNGKLNVSKKDDLLLNITI